MELRAEELRGQEAALHAKVLRPEPRTLRGVTTGTDGFLSLARRRI